MIYQQKKDKARNMAIRWQSSFDCHSYSWNEVAEWQDFFRRLARRFGLVGEFKENGII